MGIFLSYAYEKTATILLASHLVGDLERACDHVVLLSNGTVLLSQITEELLVLIFGRRTQMGIDL